MDLTYNIYGVTNSSGATMAQAMTPTKVENNDKVSAFEGFYSASLDMFNEVNDAQLDANKQQIDFLTGKTDNVLGVIMAQESALSSLNFTVQVTNKMVEVYRQIMQIQI